MRLATCLQAKDMETSMWSQSDGHQSIPLFVPPEFTSARCPSHPENHPVRFHISSPQPRATNDSGSISWERGVLRTCEYASIMISTRPSPPLRPGVNLLPRERHCQHGRLCVAGGLLRSSLAQTKTPFLYPGLQPRTDLQTLDSHAPFPPNNTHAHSVTPEILHKT